MVDLMVQCKKLERILELEKAANMTTEEMLAHFVATDEFDYLFDCEICPLRIKNICKPFHPGITCYDLWLDYLNGKDMSNE